MKFIDSFFLSLLLENTGKLSSHREGSCQVLLLMLFLHPVTHRLPRLLGLERQFELGDFHFVVVSLVIGSESSSLQFVEERLFLRSVGR
jgi:hypothetical protein